MKRVIGTKEIRESTQYDNASGITLCKRTRCNKHLLTLGKHIKRSLVDADLTAYQFGTVGVSNGISMGTRGMSYSLQSRDLIADAVETAAGGHWLDGIVVVPGCDKNMPGVLMARTLNSPYNALLQHLNDLRKLL